MISLCMHNKTSESNLEWWCLPLGVGAFALGMLLMSLGLPPPLPLKPSPPDPPITHSEFRPELLVSMMLAPSGSLEVVNNTGSWQLK